MKLSFAPLMAWRIGGAYVEGLNGQSEHELAMPVRRSEEQAVHWRGS